MFVQRKARLHGFFEEAGAKTVVEAVPNFAQWLQQKNAILAKRWKQDPILQDLKAFATRMKEWQSEGTQIGSSRKDLKRSRSADAARSPTRKVRKTKGRIEIENDLRHFAAKIRGKTLTAAPMVYDPRGNATSVKSCRACTALMATKASSSFTLLLLAATLAQKCFNSRVEKL